LGDAAVKRRLVAALTAVALTGCVSAGKAAGPRCPGEPLSQAQIENIRAIQRHYALMAGPPAEIGRALKEARARERFLRPPDFLDRDVAGY
jgi:hypothetical protein